MSEQESFPVLSIDREDIDRAVGHALGPELTDDQMREIASEYSEALEALKPRNVLADVVDSFIEERRRQQKQRLIRFFPFPFSATVKPVVSQSKHLDTTTAARQTLQGMITIEVESGVVTAVRGLPENYQYEILDHDTQWRWTPKQTKESEQ